MNAAETIAAAIEKLEDLRNASQDNPTPGRWLAHRNVATDFDVLVDYGEPDDALVVAEHVYSADAELIVTLHRTIDAQLAILRFGLKRQEAVDWTARLAGDKQREAASLELELARAILGGAS